jgi:threonine dehydrogenase-like Zn-dependent dehydrogenase
MKCVSTMSQICQIGYPLSVYALCTQVGIIQYQPNHIYGGQFAEYVGVSKSSQTISTDRQQIALRECVCCT